MIILRQKEFAKTERKFKVNGGGLNGEFTLSHEYTPEKGNGIIIDKVRNWLHGHTSADAERVLNTAEKDIRKKVNDGRLSRDLNSEVLSKELTKSLKKGVRRNQLGKAAMIAAPVVASTTAYGVSKAIRKNKEKKEDK